MQDFSVPRLTYSNFHLTRSNKEVLFMMELLTIQQFLTLSNDGRQQYILNKIF